LVGFNDQQVVGLFNFDQVSGRGFLSVDGIGADQSATQIQFVQEIFESGDFVSFGRDSDLAADEFGLGIQGAEQLDGLAVDLGGSPEAFAIDGQAGNAQILEMRAKPGRNGAVQFVGIQALEHPTDRAFAGLEKFAGFAAAAGAQAAELVLVEGLGKGPDINVGVVARNHGGGSDGDNRSHFSMEPATVATGITQGP
jgi:hypothetical protein